MACVMILLDAVQLERPVHARGSDVLRVLTESHPCGRRGMIVEHFELLPLSA